jgi:hypothetical protein
MTWKKWLSALTAISTGLVVHAQNVPAGRYVFQGGNGELSIQANGRFHIDTVGGNAHICIVEGVMKGANGLPPDSACVVTFALEGNNIRVTDNGHQECRDACGARAGYTGIYFKPRPACLPKAIAATRKSFKSLYDKQDFALAVQTLSPLLGECAPVLTYFDQGFLRNDSATAQLRNGDATACRQTLQPLQELGSMSDEDVRELPEPAYEDIYLRLARATRTNLKFCSAASH